MQAYRISLQSILIIPFHLCPGLFLWYLQPTMSQAFSIFFIHVICTFILVNHTINIRSAAFTAVTCNSVSSVNQSHDDTFDIQHSGHSSAHSIYTTESALSWHSVWCQRSSQQSQTVSGILPQCRFLRNQKISHHNPYCLLFAIFLRKQKISHHNPYCLLFANQKTSLKGQRQATCMVTTDYTNHPMSLKPSVLRKGTMEYLSLPTVPSAAHNKA
jgi:hypothetical protein